VADPRHPEAALTDYALDSLGPVERARVAVHLEACADCRQIVDQTRAVLGTLATAVPPPPPTDWGRYGAELRARVEAAPRRAWWARPLPALVAAVMAAAALVLTIHGLGQRPTELATVEETMLGARLPMLQQYRVVERLDLLEDLDAIRQLDRLGNSGS
jgi:anti-sigma factor RsiW